jgi:hypothetical protein
MFPFYLLFNLYVFIKRKLEMRKCPQFFQSYYTKNKKVLLLCHGRNYGYPLIPDVNMDECDFYTVDSNDNVWPHFTMDVLDPLLFTFYLKDIKFDHIMLFNCACHTYCINEDQTIMSKLRNVLKDDGVLHLKNNNIRKMGFKNVEPDYLISFSKITNYRTLLDIQNYFNNVTESRGNKIYMTRYIKCPIEDTPSLQTTCTLENTQSLEIYPENVCDKQLISLRTSAS